MLSKKEQLKIASELLCISYDEASKNCKKLRELNALYVWVPIMGGGAIIVGSDGSYLFAASCIPPSVHVEEYKKGRRSLNELNKKENDYKKEDIIDDNKHIFRNEKKENVIDILESINNEFKINGITLELVNFLEMISSQVIYDDSIDKFWSESARRLFILLIIANLYEKNDVRMHDFIEQTKDVNILKNIIERNIDKIKSEASSIMQIDFSLIYSDKPLKSVIDIIHNSIIVYDN